MGAATCSRRSAIIYQDAPTVLIIYSTEELVQSTEAALLGSGALVSSTMVEGALRAIEECRPDVIVLGLRSTDASDDIAARVRNTPSSSSALVFVTHDSDRLDCEAVSEYGPIVDEPLDPMAFRALVRDLADECRYRAASIDGQAAIYA